MRIGLWPWKKGTSTIIASLCFASGSLAQSGKGSVCLGDNLAKVSNERGRHVYVRVDSQRCCMNG